MAFVGCLRRLAQQPPPKGETAAEQRRVWPQTISKDRLAAIMTAAWGIGVKGGSSLVRYLMRTIDSAVAFQNFWQCFRSTNGIRDHARLIGVAIFGNEWALTRARHGSHAGSADWCVPPPAAFMAGHSNMSRLWPSNRNVRLCLDLTNCDQWHRDSTAGHFHINRLWP